MKKKILIYHPDKLKHTNYSSYTDAIYSMCEELYEVKSFEWYITHFWNKRIKCIYLNWYENTLGKAESGIVQTIQYFIKLCLLKLAKLLGHKIVYVVHNKAPHNMSLESGIYTNVYKPFFKKVLLLADTIVLVSRSSLSYILEEFFIKKEEIENKVVFVPIGLYEQHDICKVDIRRKYNISETEMIYCYAGRMNYYKNIDIIIKAFKQAHVKGKLLLVGSTNDSYYSELQKLISADANIIFDNRELTDDELTQIISNANVLVLPYENTSMNSGTLVYSFSCGTTVICTNIEMLQDYPDDLVYGYSHNTPKENLEGLICKMEKSFQDYIEGNLDRKGQVLKKIVYRDNNWLAVKEALFSAIKDD